MSFLRILLMIILCACGVLLVNFKKKKDRDERIINPAAPATNNASVEKNYFSEAASLKAFAAKHKMNTSVCFLVNMKVPSNFFRFYVYDFGKEKIIYKGMVANGKCENNDPLQIKFSNEINSGCTSLGRYKIGEKYTGSNGKSYRLYGLDSTNSNAFERAVVLHSYRYVPDKQVNYPICLSYGCPMVSQNFLDTLSRIIDTAKRPVALEIFNK